MPADGTSACKETVVISYLTTVAAARAWNALPYSVSSAPSLAIYTRLLKTHPFHRSFYS